MANSLNDYDVVILGAGFAGGCQARHLLLNVPGIRIAIIEPRSEEQMRQDRRIGESTVEMAGLLLTKELGLHEHLIENHPPKYGLNFHWPRDPGKTDRLEDHYSVWCNRNPTFPAFQVRRGKLEADLLRMNRRRGAALYRGRAHELDLPPGDQIKSVWVRTESGERVIRARHVVDSSGRQHLVGRRYDNVLQDPDHHFGLDNGASWFRIRGVDRTIFHDGLDPLGSTASHYYATNHWFGHGHWAWMIPIDIQEQELSIGVVHHHDVLPAQTINTREKLLGFLDKNHTLLYRLATSGEIADYRYLKHPCHSSKVLFSKDNWYVIGDAAYIFDAFYSLGTSTIAFQVQSVTEIIRAKLAGEPDAEKTRESAHAFNRWYMKTTNHIYRHHARQLGHASVMSWRIYFEYLYWYGSQVPMFVGKWHLNRRFVRFLLATCERWFINEVYEQLNTLVDRNANIGFMDTHRADQLIGKFTTWNLHEDYIENTRFEREQLNIFATASKMYRYLLVWYLKLQWRGFGPFFWLKRRRIRHLLH